MAKPLYLQYQEMGGEIDWPDFQLLLAWARSEGYNGTQAVTRENKNKPWGPDNCSLKADGKRPVSTKTAAAEKATAEKATKKPKTAKAPKAEEPAAEEPAEKTAAEIAASL